jgi:hypothetical protein
VIFEYIDNDLISLGSSDGSGIDSGMARIVASDGADLWAKIRDRERDWDRIGSDRIGTGMDD